MISPESWGTSFVSKHHYAIELAKQNNTVYFLNGPTIAFKKTKIEDGLYAIDYKPNYKGLRYFPKPISAYLFKKEVKALEKYCEDEFDIIWNFDSSRFFNLAYLTSKIRICHIVDMAENIQRPLLAQTSDVCFCTSDFIKEELTPYNSRVAKIHHGYKVPLEEYQLIETFDSEKVQVGYVGNLTRPCIDWELVQRLVQEYPDIQFNFIGDYSQSNLSTIAINNNILDVLKSSANVTLVGSKESNLIPSYLQRFDVLLSVYKLENEADIKQHSNLHKTMEYIGSGKVTVSTYSDEYKDKRELLEMVDDREQFFERFDKVVKNLTHYNSDEKQLVRKEFTKNNTYSKQLERIEQILVRFQLLN